MNNVTRFRKMDGADLPWHDAGWVAFIARSVKDLSSVGLYCGLATMMGTSLSKQLKTIDISTTLNTTHPTLQSHLSILETHGFIEIDRLFRPYTYTFLKPLEWKKKYTTEVTPH